MSLDTPTTQKMQLTTPIVIGALTIATSAADLNIDLNQLQNDFVCLSGPGLWNFHSVLCAASRGPLRPAADHEALFQFILGQIELHTRSSQQQEWGSRSNPTQEPSAKETKPRQCLVPEWPICLLSHRADAQLLLHRSKRNESLRFDVYGTNIDLAVQFGYICDDNGSVRVPPEPGAPSS